MRFFRLVGYGGGWSGCRASMLDCGRADAPGVRTREAIFGAWRALW